MAKKFKFRLESVLKYRKILEDGKKREFAVANRAVEEQRLKAIELEEERVEVIESIRHMRVGGGNEKLHMASMMDAMRIVGGIEMGIVSANDETKRLEKEVEEKRLAFVESQRDKKAIEILREKREISYHKELDAENQKDLDELSIRMARKKLEHEDRDKAFRSLKRLEIGNYGKK